MLKSLIVVLAALLAASPVARAEAQAADLSLGVVPQFEVRRLAAIWNPLIAALAARGAPLMHRGAAEDIPDFERALWVGAYDVAYVNPWHSVVAADRRGYTPLLRDGTRMLQGVLVVRADSPVQSPADLSGGRIAFPAPNALGATLLMRAELDRDHALTYTPRFSGSHDSAYLDVVLGLAEAAGGIEATLEALAPDIRGRLRVVHRTAMVHSHPLVVHPRVTAEQRERLVAAFLDLAATEEGKAMLARIPMADPVRAAPQDYDAVRALDLGRFVQPPLTGAAP